MEVVGGGGRREEGGGRREGGSNQYLRANQMVNIGRERNQQRIESSVNAIASLVVCSTSIDDSSFARWSSDQVR